MKRFSITRDNAVSVLRDGEAISLKHPKIQTQKKPSRMGPGDLVKSGGRVHFKLAAAKP